MSAAGEDYAIVVGVSDYPGLEDGNLPGADADAKRFHQWVTSPGGGGVPAANAQLIVCQQPTTDPLDASPSAETITKAFSRLIRRREQMNTDGAGAALGRRLWVFLSGHGIELERAGEESTPVLLAATARRLDAQHVAGDMWARYTARRCGFSEVIVILDACGSPVAYRALNLPPGSGDPVRVLFKATNSSSPTAWEIPLATGGTGGKFTTQILATLEQPHAPPGLSAVALYEALDRALGATFTFAPQPFRANSMLLV